METTNPSVTVDGWERYAHDPERARALLAGLCDRLGRDCEAEPPTLVFSYAPFPHRIAIATELSEMLGAVGIDFEAVEVDLDKMLDGCVGWEMSTWTWLGAVGFAPFAQIYQVANPAIPALSNDSLSNLYAWGTGPIEEAEDIPDTDCDESVGWVQGPSSAQNEFTERYAEVFAETLDLNPVIHLDDYFQRILELEDILADQLVFIPLFSRPFLFASRTDIIGGYDNAFVFGTVTFHWNIERWYLKQPQPGT